MILREKFILYCIKEKERKIKLFSSNSNSKSNPLSLYSKLNPTTTTKKIPNLLQYRICFHAAFSLFLFYFTLFVF